VPKDSLTGNFDLNTAKIINAGKNFNEKAKKPRDRSVKER